MLKLNHLFFNSLYLVAAFLYFTSYGNHYKCFAKRVRYINTEHPKITYQNPKCVKFVNLTSHRYGRRDPVHYIEFHSETVVSMDFNLSVDFYFYEFLTNVYKPSFIELHFELCHMLLHDPIFGAPMLKAVDGKRCPYPPRTYHLTNMSISANIIPRNFPFRKGRIYGNFTSMDMKELCGSGYIDMEISEVPFKSKN